MIHKKLYIYIYIALITFVLLLFSCEEKKAKDAVENATKKTAVDQTKETPPPLTEPKGNIPDAPQGEELPPPLTKPALSAYRVRKETPITFPKVAGHSYALKTVTSGVTLSDVEGDTTKKQVSSTKVVSGVIVVATLDGNAIDSEPIDFLLHVADKTALEAEIAKAIKEHGNDVNLNYIDTSEVTNMNLMFQGNTTFNGDISKWDTSSVTDMYAMFYDATTFNQSLNSWDVSKVKGMYRMFFGATTFNQPLTSWNVTEVTDMRNMFHKATAFNQDISGWADKSGRKTSDMFEGATAMETSHKPSWAR